MEVSELGRSLQRLRALINGNERIRARLLSNHEDWLSVCASLDAVLDTDMALEAFRHEWKAPHGGGSALLLIYGAMQCLMVQQDAVNSIFRLAAGRRSRTRDAMLEEIRTRRNQACGHPNTNAGFLVHGSLSGNNPELLLPAQSTREHEYVALDINAMIDGQRPILTQRLIATIEHLARVDSEHRRKFVNEPLVKQATALGHAISAARTEQWKQSDAAGPMFPFHVDQVEAALTALESDLRDRGELEARSDTLVHQFTFARHCLRRLRQVASQEPDGEGHMDAEAFLVALTDQARSLKEAAETIDREYAS